MVPALRDLSGPSGCSSRRPAPGPRHMTGSLKALCPELLGCVFSTLHDLCVSSLRRGHANLLCIVPILTDDPRRESFCWDAFLRSRRPRGPGKAFKKVWGEAPHIFEGLPGPPGPARPQKCTPTNPARLPSGTQHPAPGPRPMKLTVVGPPQATDSPRVVPSRFPRGCGSVLSTARRFHRFVEPAI